MNTQQEIIERDVRLLIGDLHLQLVMARAQVATLEQQLKDLAAKEPEAPPMRNGADKQPGERVGMT